jgi:uncharacterized membrane protein YjgN (DUF898 family)
MTLKDNETMIDDKSDYTPHLILIGFVITIFGSVVFLPTIFYEWDLIVGGAIFIIGLLISFLGYILFYAKEEEREIISKTLRQEANNKRHTTLRFTGNTSEYFKIWIVNVLLTILTIGIYSAWAKVRKKKYFYRNTFLLDFSFDYLAMPKKILVGRLIVFGTLIILIITGYIDPLLLLIFAIPTILLFPWIVVKALSFKAQNSSYCNIRFGFLGTYGEAIRVFILQMLITILTLGIGYFYQRYRRTQYVFNNSTYGKTSFRLRLDSSVDFLELYLWKVAKYGILVGIGNAVILLIGKALLPVVVFQVFEGIISIFISISFIAFLQAAKTNLIWSNVLLGEKSDPVYVIFKSTLSVKKMIWIYFSNTYAVVLSMGLLAPWASIRTIRYRLSNLGVTLYGELDSFIAGEQKEIGAFGEEIIDFSDFDLGL